MLQIDKVTNRLKDLVKATEDSKFVILWRVKQEETDPNYFLIIIKFKTVIDRQTLFQTGFALKRY